MNSRFKLYKYSKTPLLWSFLITLVMLLAIGVLYYRLQPQVPIFYSLARPSQHLASKYWLFLFPVISLIINFIHLLIIGLIKQLDELLMKLFAWTTVGIQLVLALALFRILVIIT